MLNTISFPALGLEFNINRAAITIGNFPVYWYGIIIAIGLVLAVIYGIFESKRVGLDSDDFYNMLIIAIPVAIICARIYYVIFSWDMYKDDILSVFNIRNGGIAIYGGIIGAAAVVYFYCRRKKISVGLVLDVLAVGLLIGQAVGRWGNFVNGEAFGCETTLPWAMTITNNGKIVAEGVHPTFLYESLWNFIGIGVLLAYKKIKVFNGEIFSVYMIWYGFGRMLIEGLRSDSLYLGFFRVSQLLSVGIAIIGIVLLVVNRCRTRRIS